MMVNNTNNHLSPQILKNTTYDVGNPCLEQKCNGVLKVNIDPNPPILINGAPTAIHIKVNNKISAQNCFKAKDHILPQQWTTIQTWTVQWQGKWMLVDHRLLARKEESVCWKPQLLGERHHNWYIQYISYQLVIII